VPFDADAVVDVEQLGDVDWKLLRSLGYQGKQERFVVEPEMTTDFASVPRVFVRLLPRYGRYTKAAILHDFLWRTQVKTGRLSWRDADGMFRRAMRELDVPFLRRWVMWAAVRIGALTKEGGTKDWWKDLPLILLLAIVMLPIVLPPALVIAVALILFYVYELIAFGLLAVGRAVAKMFRRPPPRKQLNAPTFSWKL
jgi:Protein of unknown function (DUF1353)